jgi:hypothetical protein
VNTIQINYDLKKPGRNYEPVYDYLKSYTARCPLLDSLLVGAHEQDGGPGKG